MYKIVFLMGLFHVVLIKMFIQMLNSYLKYVFILTSRTLIFKLTLKLEINMKKSRKYKLT